MSNVEGAPAPTEPKPTETLGNSPETRNPDGTIKDPAQTSPPTTTTEPKPAPTDPKSAPPAPQGVPERYEFKPPEGQQIDPKFVELASPVLKELGLTQPQAQALFDLHTKLTAESSAALERTMTDMRTEWRTKVSADPALGDGRGDLSAAAKHDLGTFKTALGDSWATFEAAMSLTGAGDHPAVVSALRTIGARLGEGTPVRGSGSSPAGQAAPNAKPKTAANAIYPNLPPSAG